MSCVRIGTGVRFGPAQYVPVSGIMSDSVFLFENRSEAMSVTIKLIALIPNKVAAVKNGVFTVGL